MPIPYATPWLLAAALALASPLSQAHEDHAGHAMPAADIRQERTDISFADVPLLDAQGMPVRLEKDLVADHIVVLGLIYTQCTTVCPVVSSIMAKVQQRLGGRVGDDVQLISLSIDPARDDPKRLAAYASRFQKGPGWSWVTGSPYAVGETLKGLGTANGNLAEHPPLILVGDGRNGRWTRYYGFTNPDVLIEEIQRLGIRRVHAKHTAIAQEQQP